MRRTAAALGVLLLAARVVSGQPADRGVARIAYLSATPLAPALVKEFEAALQELGWVPGRNVVIDYRSADGQYGRLPGLVDEVLRLKPQLILTAQTPTTQAVRKVSTTIPIVMVGHGDPVRYGVVASLARPEGNTTGTAFLVNEVGMKLLELLKEAVPRAVRVAFLVNPQNPGAAPLLEAAQALAPRLGLVIIPVEATSPAKLSQQLDGLTRKSIDAIWLGPEALLLAHRQQVLDFALAQRVPAAGVGTSYVTAGALLSYSPDFGSLVKASATYVDKILKGARPHDLPIEQPSRFELVLNARTARALEITLPPALLLRADRVIE